MALIYCKPYTSGRRGMVLQDTSHLYKGAPYKKLLEPCMSKGGRNNHGHITVNHRGGGAKRLYRIVDFKRLKDDIPAKVERIEYDPNRTAHIALVCYQDGERRYIVATSKMKVGDVIYSGPSAPIKEGNCLPLRSIPIGTVICQIELKPGCGAQMARSAGAFVQLLAKEGQYAVVRLRSGEMRKVRLDCRAVIGEVSNLDHNLCVIGTAGRKRRMGIRPTVRGVAMNPVDHALGGGEGKTSGGRPRCSAKGLPNGRRTRRNKNNSMIVRSRHLAKKG
ncbi:MAG: 50S ribosomal protein L2 [Gammaproteobacteria bacterium]|nr:50S ribosomal protein L2 [Gammaproteobacteria bacterium]